jgi:hypothetical protein
MPVPAVHERLRYEAMKPMFFVLTSAFAAAHCFAQHAPEVDASTPSWLGSAQQCGDLNCKKRAIEQTLDPEATRLLVRTLEDPADAGSRRILATHYEEGGYAALAMFYRSTASFLSTTVEIPAVVKAEYDWRCETKDTLATRSEAVKTAALVNQGKYLEALAKASADLQRQQTCAIMLAWADAIRVNAEVRSRTDLQNCELAIRILTTLAEEAHEFPESSAQGLPGFYLSISDYFLAQRDYVSAYVATREAQKWLTADDSLSDYMKSGEGARVLRERIGTRLRLLASRLPQGVVAR